MGYTFNPEEFHMGMNVEMEHKDVTNGNVVKTAKIAAAHLTEKPNYYTLLKKYVEKPKEQVPTNITVDKAVFVGSTAELLKKLKNEPSSDTN